jgi:hypothetical protein
MVAVPGGGGGGGGGVPQTVLDVTVQAEVTILPFLEQG